MKIKKTSLVLVVFGAVLAAAPAYAVGVSLVGEGVYSMATGTPTPTATFGYPGGGLIFNFRLGSKVDFELGGAYSTRFLAVDTTNTQTMIMGLGGFRLKFSRSLFLNFGGYYNYMLNDPLASTGSDYGLDAGLGIIIPIGSTAGILINPRYHYSLTTMTYSTGTYTPSEIIGFVGLSFGMGGKN
ncbi:MAG: hypothetical protein HYX41_04990 [Bdellovibrio sp.]|nr:hypothetical protein [Bdellovibrio sp.]